MRTENLSNDAADHAIVLGLDWRLRRVHAPELGRGPDSNIGVRLEFSRREPHSGEPDNAVQARVQARW